MNNLLQRVLVSLIGIPLAIFIVTYGREVLLVAVVIVSSMALWEYYKLAEAKNASPNKILGVIFSMAFIITFYFFHTNSPDFIFILIVRKIFIIRCKVTVQPFEVILGGKGGSVPVRI